MSTLTVHGGNVVLGQELQRASLIVDGDRIAAIDPAGRAERGRAGAAVDATGCTVLPGFVDLQVNGALGADLTSRPELVGEVAAFLPRCGVTSFMPTIISSPVERIDRGVRVLQEWRAAAGHRDVAGARSIGVHVEGPFLHPTRVGAHPERHLRLPALESVGRWARAHGVGLVTIAPELPGAADVIEHLVRGGVTVCAGHTSAGPELLDEAARLGVSGVTHLFNAMGPMSARAPGPAGAALAHPTLIAGLIVDGVHVDPTMVRLAWRALGPDRIALVTDAMAALGLPLGAYSIGDTVVLVDEHGVRTPEGVLAGSVLRFDDAVRNLMAYTGCDIVAASRAASSTPARLAQVDDIGRLTVGALADIVLLDAEDRVVVTVVGGDVVWDPEHRCGEAGAWRS